MKNLKFFTIFSVVLLTGMILAGCKSMQIDYMETDTVEGPRQVRQGQDINPREITVWAMYMDGRRRVVPVTSGSITFNKHTPGRQIVRVRVQSQEVSFETEVMAIRALNVASPPRTVLFKQGEEPNPLWPGLEIRGEWDQMGSHAVDIRDCEVTGFMKDQAGRQTIRVAYEGLTTTFDIDVRSMTAIQIAQQPTKVDYLQGETLNLEGLRVTGVWEGFPAEELHITFDDVTGYNPNRVGVQPITVTKNGRSVAFNVEVLGLTSLELDRPPNKTAYFLGEELELDGIIVYGNYTGSDPSKRRRELIPENQLVVSGYNANLINQQQRVTVTVGSASANFFVTVSLPPAGAAPQQSPEEQSNTGGSGGRRGQ